MSIQLQINAESDLLTVVATGNFSLEAAKRTFLQIVKASARRNCKKVLLDGRNLTGNPEGMERFYYGEFVAETVMNSIANGVFAPRQFAYVLREPILDPRRFGETVAVNRGVNAKTIETRKDALHWLGIAQASKPVPRKGSAPALRNDSGKDLGETTQAALLGSLAGSLRGSGIGGRNLI